MISLAVASTLARDHCPDSNCIDDSEPIDFPTGWYFGYKRLEDPLAQPMGSNGLIVDKATGEVLVLGSAFSVQRDLEMHQKGYRYSQYDLVVLAFSDLEQAIDALSALRLSTVDPKYESGTVWRIPRPLTRAEPDRAQDRPAET
ncbi:MAG TPA: hypothetical protein VNW92_21695 [Polyangiaceae bacterium]|jgi:hypothetical protein|nr:hypothetical protein [Polyangiaceae bacterium]